MAGNDPPMSPNLKPIATRPREERPLGVDGSGASSSSGGAGPHSHPMAAGGVPNAAAAAELQSDSPAMGSDSSSPWRRFFRGGNKYAGSDLDSFGNSPRNIMGFSPKATSSNSARCAP